jgi:hypothetical protein
MYDCSFDPDALKNRKTNAAHEISAATKPSVGAVASTRAGRPTPGPSAKGSMPAANRGTK